MGPGSGLQPPNAGPAVVTERTGRTAANLAIAAAGAATLYAVATRPKLRRLVFRAARLWLGTSVPGYILSTIGQAWQSASADHALDKGPRAKA